MAEKDKKNSSEKTSCCCSVLDVYSGFKFGFGMFISFLVGISILILIATIYFYITKLL